MYKMYLILPEGYKNVNVEFLTIKITSEIWVSVKDVGNGIGVKNVSDLVLKEICGICETKNLSKEQVNEYKMTKAYVKNDVMTTVIKRCRGGKTRGKRAIHGYRKN